MGERDPVSLEYDNRARVPEHPAILARWWRDSAEARSRLRHRADVPYGGAAGERLDLFPAPRRNAAALVFIHGGYWRAMDKNDFSFLAPAWVDAGISLIVVNYSLCPLVSMQEIVRQMLRASIWIYRHADDLRVNRDRLYVCGHSAGGQLAAMMMAALWKKLDRRLPKSIFSGAATISGLHDLRPLAKVDFLRDDLKLNERSALRLSPAYLPPASEAPVLACAGGLESDEYHRQTRLLQERWSNAAQLRSFVPAANHFTMMDELADPSSELFKSMIRLVKMKTPGCTGRK